MKIKVKEDNIRLSFWIPTSLLFSKFILKSLFNEKIDDFDEIKIISKELKKALKQYIKLNGHFTFLEVKTKDNEYVKIDV